MFFHFRNRITGAIHIEVSSEFGIEPLYSFSKWNDETIVDLPWVRIILTSAKRLQQEKDNVRHAKPFESPLSSARPHLSGCDEEPSKS